VTGTPTIRVLVADDHAIVRAGVRMLLEAQEDVQVIGEAADGREALRLAHQLSPDVVLMDIAMPEMTGLEATRELTRRAPGTKVLILTMHGTDEYFFRLLEVGASGYLLKEAAPADLVAAVRAVHGGGAYLPPALARRLLGEYLQQAGAGGEERQRLGRLSDREQDVLRLVAEGLTSQEIAERLYLSVNTVQTHRRHIMEKLDLHDRGQLVSYAHRAGLLTLGAAESPAAE
jgi:two-component system response regulator NreC